MSGIVAPSSVAAYAGCPEWSDDVPVHHAREFDARVAAAVLTIDRWRGLRACPTADDLKTLHRKLFEGFAPLPCYVGNFRGVGGSGEERCLDYPVAVGPVLGFPPSQVATGVDAVLSHCQGRLSSLETNWTGLSSTDRAEKLAEVVAVLIGGLIRVHPFVNGNGRTSRLVWGWTLGRYAVPRQVRIHPRPPSFYGTCMGYAMRGDYGPLYLRVLDWLTQHAPSAAAAPT